MVELSKPSVLSALRTKKVDYKYFEKSSRDARQHASVLHTTCSKITMRYDRVGLPKFEDTVNLGHTSGSWNLFCTKTFIRKLSWSISISSYPVMSVSSLLKYASQPKIAKKTKIPLFEFQGR